MFALFQPTHPRHSPIRFLKQVLTEVVFDKCRRLIFHRPLTPRLRSSTQQRQWLMHWKKIENFSPGIRFSTLLCICFCRSTTMEILFMTALLQARIVSKALQLLRQSSAASGSYHMRISCIITRSHATSSLSLVSHLCRFSWQCCWTLFLYFFSALVPKCSKCLSNY